MTQERFHELEAHAATPEPDEYPEPPWCPGCGAETDEECTCPNLAECSCVHLADCGPYPGCFAYVADPDCPHCGGAGTVQV